MQISYHFALTKIQKLQKKKEKKEEAFFCTPRSTIFIYNYSKFGLFEKLNKSIWLGLCGF